MLELLTAIVPTIEFPPGIPLTSQEIAAPLAMQDEVVRICVWPSETLAAGGEIEFIEVQVMVTLAAPDFEASATLVAITLTVAGEGGVAGAV